MKRKAFFVFLSVLFLFCKTDAQVRYHRLLEQGWKFSRTDNQGQELSEYNDQKWQQVRVPHDWAIYGPFSWKNDLQEVAISQDGQKEAMEHAGRTGGLPFVGVGWYRLSMEVPALQPGQRVFIKFDGAMSRPHVFLNGQFAGKWGYGYNSFFLDVTSLVKGGAENLLAVRLENLSESSRWYPGAGLYRNVHLIITNDVHIPIWGTYVTTPVVRDDFAKVCVETKVVVPKDIDVKQIKLRSKIVDLEGNVVAEETKPLGVFDECQFVQELVVEHPELWDLETPNLYRLVSQIYKGTELKDEYTTTFGIRTIEIKPNDGFYLNGRKTVFQGVCLHHDLGPLGAAVNESAIRRQIRILKDMGCNAIRTSHNMPAPELVKVCDEMGMMVMAESFDEWKIPKVRNGYNLFFDEWAEKDMMNLLHNFRNNPSVVMWCIGNEVPEQGVRGASKVARFLQDICHREDPSRPVTQGMDQPDAVLNNNFAAVMEVAGFNYRPHKYQEAYEKLPQQIILGSETASTVSSRGVYKFPVVRQSMKKYPDHQSSSYDVEHCGWSNLPEDDFMRHEDLPYCIGEFVWTGFDYLGEPTPYYTDWPSHSSLFGIVDLGGIPKDRYYLYRSHWNKKEETLHVLPHWTWPDRIGEVTPVFVYTNYPTAELFLNGKSLGKRTKKMDVSLSKTENEKSRKTFERQKRYRLMWNDVVYEPGELRVVAYDAKGNVKAEKVVRTAGKPYAIRLRADREILKADGKDIAFVQVEVVDRNGILCPNAAHQLSFKVKGAAHYRASANGNPSSLELFHEPHMNVFNGMLTTLVESGEKQGNAVLEVSGKGLKSATIQFKVK